MTSKLTDANPTAVDWSGLIWADLLSHNALLYVEASLFGRAC